MAFTVDVIATHKQMENESLHVAFFSFGAQSLLCLVHVCDQSNFNH